jgi:hypothetical protein
MRRQQEENNNIEGIAIEGGQVADQIRNGQTMLAEEVIQATLLALYKAHRGTEDIVRMLIITIEKIATLKRIAVQHCWEAIKRELIHQATLLRRSNSKIQLNHQVNILITVQQAFPKNNNQGKPNHKIGFIQMVISHLTKLVPLIRFILQIEMLPNKIRSNKDHSLLLLLICISIINKMLKISIQRTIQQFLNK